MKAWIARDSDGLLHVFYAKPTKGSSWWFCSGYCSNITEQDLPDGINPQWTDDEPIEINLKLERVS